MCATCVGLYLGHLQSCQLKTHTKGFVLDCNYTYSYILLIIEHNGDVSPEKGDIVQIQRALSYSHIFIVLKHEIYNVKVLYKTYRILKCTRVGTLIVATIYLQLIQNRYMFRSFTVLHCSHQHCLEPVASDVEVVGHL